MRRRLLIVGVLILVGAGIWLLRTPCPVNSSSFARIKNGMYEREVEAIFGGPAGDYSGHVVEYSWVHDRAPRTTQQEKFWIGDFGVARVCFDKEGQVVFSEFLKTTAHAESLTKRIRRWLRI